MAVRSRARAHGRVLTVRLTPEAFAKPPGGVRRASIELLAALRRTPGVAVSVSPRVEATTMMTPTPSPLGRGVLQIAEAPFSLRGRLAGSEGVLHSLYYDHQRLLSGWPLVVTLYDMIHERFGIGSKWLRRAKRFAVANASLIVTHSHATARDVRKFFPDLRANVITIPLGIGSAFLEQPQASRREVERPFLLYVGARSGYKNFEVLGRALAAADDLDDFRLVLVGGEQLLDGERRDLVGRLRTPDRLDHVVGASDDVLVKLYDEAAALVITSRCEGFGLPLLEAMARGCPVACSTGGSSEELLGESAAVFHPDSPAECVDAIRRATTASDA
jgi:glycosyltransferase involved in cell wall biosynthesis